MTLQTALSAGDLVNVRSDYAGAQLIVLNDNTTIFKAQINQTAFGDSVGQVTYDGVTVGAYTDIEVGQTIFFSHTDDIRAAYHVGRVRKTPTSSILYIDETSEDLQDDDFAWVLQDWRESEKLATVSSTTYFKDFDEAFRELDPIITNLATVYAGKVTGTPAGFTQRFQPTAIAGTSGGSISSYAFTIETGMTVTAGDPNTADVTIRFDQGKHWLKMVVTDSGGRTATRWIWVIAYPEALTSVVEQGFGGSTITGDLDSPLTASIKAFDGIDTVLDNTLCAIIDVSYHAGAETIIDSNVRFVGRLRTETGSGRTDENYGLLSEVDFEVEGPAAILGRLKAPRIDILHDTTPTVWDEVNNATYWRAIAHLLQTHTTFLTLHALSFSDTSNDSVFDLWAVGGSDVLSEVNGIAEDWVANAEFHPDGRMAVEQRGPQLDTTGRSALPTIADQGTQDYVELGYSDEHVKAVTVIQGGGGTYITATDKVNPVLSVAPGEAPGEGSSPGKLPGQVLPVNLTRSAAQTEIDRRVGHALAEQNPAPILTVTHPDGYGFIIPSRAQWYTWTLSSDDLMKRGIAFTTATRWLVQSVNYSHDNNTGRKQCEVVYQQETEGQAGQEPEQSAATGVSITIPPIPPFPAFPNFPPPISLIGEPPPFWTAPVTPGITPGTIEGVLADGNAVFFGTGAGATNPGCWITQGLIVDALPDFIEVTPPALPSGYDIRHGHVGAGIDAYLLASNGSSSILFYKENVWQASPTWQQRDTLGAPYDVIRVGSTQGEVYLYARSTGSQPIDYDVDYWLSSEFVGSYNESHTSNFGEQFLVDLDTAYPGAVGILIDWSATVTGGAGNLGVQTDGIEFNDLGFTALFVGGAGGYSGSHIFINPWTEASKFPTYTDDVTKGSPDLPTLRSRASLRLHAGGNYGAGGTIDFTGTARIIVAKSVQSFPGSGTPDKAATVFSDDYGATFGSAQIIGDPPTGSYGGMDTIKIGDLALAAQTGQVDSAQSGGAYSAYGVVMPTGAEPADILIPRFELDSVADNNGGTTTPDYLVASDLLTASNEALWTVVNSGVDFTDITPYDGSNYGLATGPNCLAMSWRSGKKIAAILMFGSLPKLYVTEDTGATWLDRGVLGGNANALTFRKGDADLDQLFGTDTHIWYSLNSGQTLTTKKTPASDPIEWISVYG